MILPIGPIGQEHRIDVRWVRCGRSAADALRVAISSAKGDKPLSPVTIVVPANDVGVATRRLLASGGLGPVCSLIDAGAELVTE
jgi:hypothetical protein